MEPKQIQFKVPVKPKTIVWLLTSSLATAVNNQVQVRIRIFPGPSDDLASEDCQIDLNTCTIACQLEKYIYKRRFSTQFHTDHQITPGGAGARLYQFQLRFMWQDPQLAGLFEVATTTLHHALITHTSQESNAVASLIWHNIYNEMRLSQNRAWYESYERPHDASNQFKMIINLWEAADTYNNVQKYNATVVFEQINNYLRYEKELRQLTYSNFWFLVSSTSNASDFATVPPLSENQVIR